MCVMTKGGTDAKLMCPILIFKNAKSNYPVQGLPDSVKDVCYRTSPSAFFKNRIMVEWLRKNALLGPGGQFAKERNVWLDNTSGRSGEEVMKAGMSSGAAYSRPLFSS
ncbi:hypothetical protein PHMEG_0009076 [Phytophthora megakarya]|uniref:Uncharacterized protein n=1 Tax=Phytophthora megakarya TaxID=4795 RepID=A0A225WHN7_9STRA|nr:hypothetical protein PHMEG_0009076 [Phytophthora megakarya]